MDMIDELEKSKAQLAAEIDELNRLIEEATSIMITDPQRSLTLVTQIEQKVELLSPLNDPIASLVEAKLSVLHGGLAYASSDYQGLIQHINLALPTLDQWPEETLWRSRAYRILGTSYAQLGDKENLVHYLRIALGLARKGEHKREMATTLNVLAYYEEPETKIEMYQEAMGLVTHADNPMAYATVAANLAEGVYRNRQDRRSCSAIRTGRIGC